MKKDKSVEDVDVNSLHLKASEKRNLTRMLRESKELKEGAEALIAYGSADPNELVELIGKMAAILNTAPTQLKRKIVAFATMLAIPKSTRGRKPGGLAH